MKAENIIKLSKAVNEIKPIVKDSLNPHFKNRYFDINGMLEVVKPILAKNGLLLLQPILQGNVCSQIFDAETGELVAESSLEMSTNLNAQQKGSEITYFRRYTLQSLLALEAEDDDANTAATPTQAAPKAPEPEKWLNVANKQGEITVEWNNILKGITDGKVKSVADVRKYFKVSKEVAQAIEEALKS
jgi:hypothetical protein